MLLAHQMFSVSLSNAYYFLLTNFLEHNYREGLERPYISLPAPEGDLQEVPGEALFTRTWSNRTRGDGFKLKECRFRLDTRKKLFTIRVVRHWHRLPREAVAAPSLGGFKARLDGAFSNLVLWKLFLLMTGGFKLDDL